jgi:hypothetical protein
MLKRFAGILVVLAILVGGQTALAPGDLASALSVPRDPVVPVEGECTEGIQTIVCGGRVPENPGDPARNPDTGFTPAPPTCVWMNAPVFQTTNVIECQDQYLGWWSNAQQCYLKTSAALAPPPPPPGADPTGAWYACAPYDCRSLCWGSVFLNHTPPGVTQITPGAAAYELLETIALAPITIGMAPDPNVAESRSYVGVPIWMWATTPTPETYGPYEVTETLGGITITATARVTSIIWTMGDGSTVACATAGTPYEASLGFAESPNCGYRYTTVSTGQPDGRFPITATSQWTMDWAVGATTGTLETTRTAATSVEIRELQSVNVGN